MKEILGYRNTEAEFKEFEPRWLVPLEFVFSVSRFQPALIRNRFWGVQRRGLYSLNSGSAYLDDPSPLYSLNLPLHSPAHLLHLTLLQYYKIRYKIFKILPTPPWKDNPILLLLCLQKKNLSSHNFIILSHHYFTISALFFQNIIVFP